MPIDLTAALAVNMAAGPRTFAFFLGAGVSTPAGIKSGRKILEETCRRYYVVRHAQAPPKGTDVLEWATKELSPQSFRYSTLLEAVFPTPAQRQQYLQPFFEGKKPTDAHRRLASMARQGWIRVFITTNFDHLLEDALAGQGVSFTCVSSPRELHSKRPREHCGVFILKLHGDYLSSDIRNTDAELAVLDPIIRRQLASILDAYGLVVIGYKGDDPGVWAVLSSHRARSGVYWVVQRHSSPPENRLSAVDARVIEAEDADAFCRDLETRIQALALHADGRTPQDQKFEVIHLLRQKDEIGLQLRAEQLADRLQQDVFAFGDLHRWTLWGTPPSSNVEQLASWESIYQPVLDALAPAMDSYSAAAMATGKYGKFEPSRLDWFVAPLVRLFRSSLPGGGHPVTLSLSCVPAILVGNALLVSALMMGKWEMFVRVALALDVQEGVPWTLTSAFRSLQLLNLYVTLTGALCLRWLEHSQAVQQVKRSDQKESDFLAQASVLLWVAARARGIAKDEWWWGFSQHGHVLEPLVRTIVYGDTAADCLAGLISGTRDDLRTQFHAYYREQVESGRYGFADPLRPDILDLLIQKKRD